MGPLRQRSADSMTPGAEPWQRCTAGGRSCVYCGAMRGRSRSGDGGAGQRLEPAQARKCPRPRPPARTAATPGPPSEGTDVAPRSRGASVAPTADARQRRAGATTSGRFSPLLGNGTLREAQVRTQNTRRHCCVCTDDSAASALALSPGTLRSQRAPRRATPGRAAAARTRQGVVHWAAGASAKGEGREFRAI